MISIRTSTLLCFVFLLGSLTCHAQTDGEGITYGSFKLRKSKEVTCIPDSLVGNIEVLNEDIERDKKTGILQGTVSIRNSSYRVVPGAFITVFLEDSIIAYGLSDAEGKYTIQGIPPGRYRIDVCRLGYEFTTLHGLALKAGNTTFADIQLAGTYQTHEADTTTTPDSVGTFKIRMKKTPSIKAPGSVQGSVTLVGSEYPLEKIIIELYQDGVKMRSVHCDEEGKFKMLKLPDGMYEVNVVTSRKTSNLVPGVSVNAGRIKLIDIRISQPEKTKGKGKGKKR